LNKVDLNIFRLATDRAPLDGPAHSVLESSAPAHLHLLHLCVLLPQSKPLVVVSLCPWLLDDGGEEAYRPGAQGLR